MLPVVAIIGPLAPSAASAWSVTVHVHGAGKVVETTPRMLMDCTVGPDGKAESTVTNCVAGTTSGVYNSFGVVNLRASVPQAAADRGWQFLKYVDSTAGGGQINCDPQETGGDHFSVDCQFQIFENLQTHLYFDDTAGPNDTALSGGPPAITNQTAASFGFNAPSDPDASYECQLDRPGQPGSWAVCGNSTTDKAESYSDLTANGQYTFRVRGKDPSGNVDGTPASYSWTVDTEPPTPSIGGGPAQGSTVSSTSASFLVNTNQGTLTCNLDGAITSCTPGTTMSYPGPLGQGPHTFTLTATDAAGNTAAVTRNWTVDTTPPVVSFTAGPANGSFINDVNPRFEFVANETATFECSRDGGAFEGCTSPQD